VLHGSVQVEKTHSPSPASGFKGAIAFDLHEVVRDGVGRGRNALSGEGSIGDTIGWRCEGSMPESANGERVATGERQRLLCQDAGTTPAHLASFNSVQFFAKIGLLEMVFSA